MYKYLTKPRALPADGKVKIHEYQRENQKEWPKSLLC